MKLQTRIHSVESCGTVDGPGLRYVIFTQGCLLRCLYCHNPDTWAFGNGEGKEISVEELMQDIQDYLPFLQASNGGVTVSGGEPLLHTDFLIELFSACKKLGIHTCIDSSGGCFTRKERFLQSLDRLMEVTDLVLLDLKQIDEHKHKQLTRVSNQHILDFARYLEEKQKPVWIRHVLVPGWTDNEEDLRKLSAFIHSLPNVEKIEILPYHQLGVYKYEALGIDYPLKNVQSPTDEKVKWAYALLTQGKMKNDDLTRQVR
ncbi:pyruvate formate-lyase-activating protein [Lederbergia sp. NSJ-179]|uniref:pyruvate formate-lyase-activating protein n=1 Tax=Lederbergia sp. NSJ-179 TaxID=2931402 RepID=UPI001FD3F82B|nr:pyruvate formate-lyase-activating protein [Lederbergia sp. NSJ-179]MCJ7843538.1 pyruvate formate-lyase-activating protein [Lederbergia sp. NSJ-179]